MKREFLKNQPNKKNTQKNQTTTKSFYYSCQQVPLLSSEILEFKWFPEWIKYAKFSTS